MTILGITGPTGAGKTTLLREVEKLGGAVIDCDAVYHELLESDLALQNRLEQEFGPIRDETGAIDRKKLGAVVFHDSKKLETLNAIAWKAVVSQTREQIETYRKQGRGLVAVDAIALLESPLKELCQLSVAVLAPPEVRVRRIMAREGISEDYAWARVRAQKPDEYFSQHCDHTLINNCPTAEEFSQQVREFLKEVII
ncbi:dephospho-CoA kinase [Flintibacter muris]|uniref:dephospho-CoA kinase n=1 Tax=Flintibacter muris TaxID=2941327 RepID=UPI0020424888|nr:dephospho-CoA kinase [Flintibacter muris]